MASGSHESSSEEPLLTRDSASQSHARGGSAANERSSGDSKSVSSTAGARTTSGGSSALPEAPMAKKALAQQDSKVGQPNIEKHRSAVPETPMAKKALAQQDSKVGQPNIEKHPYAAVSGAQEDVEEQNKNFLQDPLSSREGTSRVIKHQSEPSNLNAIRGTFVASACFILVGFVCFLLAVRAWIFNRSGDTHISTFSGFCCWRQHPLPYYHGDACNCPVEHRGYYECPPGGCTDSSGERWQRGHRLPEANDEVHCKSSEDAAWCHTELSENGVPIAVPVHSPKSDHGGRQQDRPKPQSHNHPETHTPKQTAEKKAENERTKPQSHHHPETHIPKPTSSKPKPQLPATTTKSPSPHLPKDGFCCWRDHPLPFYSGDSCSCPQQHRGDYECPPSGCKDASDTTWHRGSTFPIANTQAFCQHPKHERIASWCAPLGAPAHLPRPSLFCWTVIQASSPELALLKHHYLQGENIFACDDQLVISDENITIGDASVWALGAFNSQRAPWHAWYNVPLFARAWKAVLSYGHYKKYEWTVKMDADAVVNVRALRAKLSLHGADPDQAIYWENINGSEINLPFNFLGPLEVLSRHAVDSFAKRGEYVCPVPKIQVQGEDSWMDACMKKLHVTPKADFSLLKDACTKCPKLPPLACASCKYAAFHPFKDIENYRECSRLLHSTCHS